MAVERSEQRHRVDLQGRYRSGNGLGKDVSVSDLSAHGCKFYDRFCNLSPGDWLSIRIGSIGPIEAQVRWTRDFVVGVLFRSPLHISVLEHMISKLDENPGSDRGVGDSAQAIEKSNEAEPSDEEERFSIIMRPPRWQDLRMVLSDPGKGLPISSHAEALDFFYRLLERVAVETTPSGSGSGDA